MNEKINLPDVEHSGEPEAIDVATETQQESTTPRREYTAEDVQEIKQWCENIQQRYGDPGLDKNLFYEFLVAAERGATTERKEDIPREEYETLILGLFNGWKNYLPNVNEDNLPANQEHLPAWLENMKNFRDARNIDELRELFRQIPSINTISPATYQDGVREKGEASSGFLHIDMSKFNGYIYERPTSEYRVYANPALQNIPSVARQLINTCQQNRVPLYFKMIDYSCDGVELNGRSDRIVIYTDEKDLPFMEDTMRKIAEEHPDWFTGRTVPKMAAKISEGIALAQDLTEKQHKIGESFSDVRSKFMINVYQEATREIILRYSNQPMYQGRSETLEQAYVERALSVNGKISPGELFTALRTVSPSNLTSRTEAEDACKRAVSKLGPNIIKMIKPELLEEIVTQKIKELAPDYEIDPDNLAFNKIPEDKTEK